eukprot:gene8177-biopygen7145
MHEDTTRERRIVFEPGVANPSESSPWPRSPVRCTARDATISATTTPGIAPSVMHRCSSANASRTPAPMVAGTAGVSGAAAAACVVLLASLLPEVEARLEVQRGGRQGRQLAASGPLAGRQQRRFVDKHLQLRKTLGRRGDTLGWNRNTLQNSRNQRNIAKMFADVGRKSESIPMALGQERHDTRRWNREAETMWGTRKRWEGVGMSLGDIWETLGNIGKTLQPTDCGFLGDQCWCLLVVANWKAQSNINTDVPFSGQQREQTDACFSHIAATLAKNEHTQSLRSQIAATLANKPTPTAQRKRSVLRSPPKRVTHDTTVLPDRQIAKQQATTGRQEASTGRHGPPEVATGRHGPPGPPGEAARAGGPP